MSSLVFFSRSRPIRISKTSELIETSVNWSRQLQDTDIRIIRAMNNIPCIMTVLRLRNTITRSDSCCYIIAQPIQHIIAGMHEDRLSGFCACRFEQ